MRPVAIAAAAGAVAALCVVGYLALPDDVDSSDAAPGIRARASARPRGPQDSTAEAEVARLAALGDVGSRQVLLERYAEWVGMDDKRTARERIIDALAAGEDGKKALKQVLEAIASDPTPLDADPLIDHAAERLQVLWKDPVIYQYGRDAMMVQPEDKPRATLVTSLVDHASRLTDQQDPDQQQRHLLATDLVDIYAPSGEAARARILAGARQLGANDIALALGGAKAGELQLVKDRMEETEQVIIDLKAGGAEGLDHVPADRRELLRQADKP